MSKNTKVRTAGWKALLKQAAQARKNAYAPYSKFRVGAAVESKSGFVSVGCNVENASYGATICAERNAILQMVAQGHGKISKVLVVTETEHPARPCALCLQVIGEFANQDCLIAVASPRKVLHVYSFHELLPLPFDGRFLK